MKWKGRETKERQGKKGKVEKGRERGKKGTAMEASERQKNQGKEEKGRENKEKEINETER